MISVIIPTFNKASLLMEAIESVLSQTFQDFEIIIIDDGSTDGTGEIVEKIGDPRIVYHFQNNEGVNRARNKGIEISKGDHLAFLDHDDIWLPFKLELQMACLDKHPEVDFVFSNFNALFDETKKIIPSYIKKQYSVFSQNKLDFQQIFSFREDIRTISKRFAHIEGSFFWGNMLPTILLGNYALNPSRLIRKRAMEKIGGFSEKFPITDDYEAIIRMSKNGMGGYIDIPTLDYRIRKNSLSHSSENSIRKWKESIEIVESALRDNEEIYKKHKVRYDKNLASFHFEIATLYDIDKKRNEAIEHWNTSIKFNPLNIKAYSGLLLGGLLPIYASLKDLIKSLVKGAENRRLETGNNSGVIK